MKKNITLIISLLVNVALIFIILMYAYTPYFDFLAISTSVPRLCEYARINQPAVYPDITLCHVDELASQVSQMKKEQAIANWQTYNKDGLTFQYPANWTTSQGDTDTAIVDEFDTLKLYSFSTVYKDTLGGEELSSEETYSRFKEAFNAENTLSETIAINNVTIEKISFTDAGMDNGIFALETPISGTVALWRSDIRTFALLDIGDKHQEDGEFDRMIQTVNFIE